MPSSRRLGPAAALLGAVIAFGANAAAQDASMVDAMVDATASDAMSTADGGTVSLPVCSGAITTASGPVTFHRAGPVEFGPGTGMNSVGSHSSLGLDYNLLFSGNYEAEMRGHLNLDWPRALSITAVGEPNGGYLDVTFGLRMLATLWVAGQAIPIPLDVIIGDHEGHGRSMFTPWAWNYEGTLVHLNVSDWRTLYSTQLNVAGSDVIFELQMRYNVDVEIQTVEIGFPDRSQPTALQTNLAVITESMPVGLYPPPRDGNLDLLTRWKSKLRYGGRFEFRINPRCASSFDLTCRAATGLLGSILGTLETPPLITTTDTLPDPFDNMPHFDLPVQQVDRAMVDFGEVHIGETATDQFVISNPGRSTLASDTGTSTEPAFVVGPGGCVPAGGMLPVPVTFRPTSVGQFTTEIMVNSNGTVGTPTRVVLYGRGVTTPTMRPNAVTDGGVNSGRDGGPEYFGPRLDAACGCRTPGGNGSRGQSVAFVAMAAVAAVLAQRKRR